MTAPVDYQRLSNTYDAQRQIIVMYREHAPGKPWSDKPYPAQELAADITPLALAELIAADEIECERDDVTAIYQIEDDGQSITNITKAVFAEAFRIEALNYRHDPEEALSQLGLDNERNRRAMEGV